MIIVDIVIRINEVLLLLSGCEWYWFIKYRRSYP